jgi:hypothetical protein
VLQEPRVQLKDGLDCTKKEPTSVPNDAGAVYYRFIPPQVGKAGAELKGNEINAFTGHKLLDVVNERLGHRRHGRRGRKPLAPVNPQVPQHASHRLQGRHVDVEVHPVDRLVLEHHMVTQYVRRRSCYRHCGLRSSTGPRTHRASSSHTQGMSLQARPESTHIDRNPQLLGIRYTSSV